MNSDWRMVRAEMCFFERWGCARLKEGAANEVEADEDETT